LSLFGLDLNPLEDQRVAMDLEIHTLLARHEEGSIKILVQEIHVLRTMFTTSELIAVGFVAI
jgi:hypothetical protein